MDAFKIKNFQDENPDLNFPEFTSLSEKSCYELRVKIFHLVNANEQEREDELFIVNHLLESGVVIKDQNSNDDNFNLIRTLETYGISDLKKVFLNWYRFDEIDEIQICDLNTYFTDIWYPYSDDIDIFDSSLKWFLSIRHDGIVSLKK